MNAQEPLARVDQQTRPATPYTVLYRVRGTDVFDVDAWYPLGVVESTSQANARRAALTAESDPNARELIRIAQEQEGATVELVAVPNFAPVPVEVEVPPPPAPRIRC